MAVGLAALPSPLRLQPYLLSRRDGGPLLPPHAKGDGADDVKRVAAPRQSAAGAEGLGKVGRKHRLPDLQGVKGKNDTIGNERGSKWDGRVRGGRWKARTSFSDAQVSPGVATAIGVGARGGRDALRLSGRAAASTAAGSAGVALLSISGRVKLGS